jgi:hypothetical protein
MGQGQAVSSEEQKGYEGLHRPDTEKIFRGN